MLKVKARKIMKEDLHLTTQVEPPRFDEKVEETIKNEMGVGLKEILSDPSVIDADAEEASLPLPT